MVKEEGEKKREWRPQSFRIYVHWDIEKHRKHPTTTPHPADETWDAQSHGIGQFEAVWIARAKSESTSEVSESSGTCVWLTFFPEVAHVPRRNAGVVWPPRGLKH